MRILIIDDGALQVQEELHLPPMLNPNTFYDVDSIVSYFIRGLLYASR